jgi:hypothetical protein
MLFGQDKQQTESKTDAPYETVDEGMTTDTTDLQSEHEE